jgi:tetratricopeptide (TPR) repeat protein
MTPARLALPVVLTLPLLLGAQQPAAPEALKDVSLEASAFELADQLWRNASYEVAGEYLEKFLTELPKSGLAPEARYRLAAAYLLLGKSAEAKAAFEKLVQDHFASPWAQLALTAHYDEEGLIKLVDAKRKQAREAHQPEEAQAGLKLLDLHARRFPQGGKSKEELAYRRGDCCRLAGDEVGFASAMKQVVDLDKDGDWGKLATVRLAGLAAFPAKMDELVRLSVGDAEQNRVFLDLAEQALPTLKGEALIKCLSYQARCLPEERKEQRRALHRRIRKEFPTSPWAAESAFWLAEAAFADKEFEQAKAGYLDLAARYPHSPRAAQARRWAGWIDEREATGRELEQLVKGLLARLSAPTGGFAFRFRGEDAGHHKSLAARFAYQSATNDTFISLRLGELSVLLANNKDGFWYQPAGRAELVKGPPTKLPRPTVVAQPDLANRHLSFGFGINGDDQAPPASPFQVHPDLAPALVAGLQGLGHVHVEKGKEADKKAGAVVRLELAASSWDATEPTAVEVVVSSGGGLAEVRGSWCNAGGRKLTATVSDIVLGETLPAEVFAVKVPAGITVRPVQMFNVLEVWADAMRLLAVVGQEVKGDARK